MKVCGASSVASNDTDPAGTPALSTSACAAASPRDAPRPTTELVATSTYQLGTWSDELGLTASRDACQRLQLGQGVVDDDGFRPCRPDRCSGALVGDPDVQHVLRGVHPRAGERRAEPLLEGVLDAGQRRAWKVSRAAASDRLIPRSRSRARAIPGSTFCSTPSSCGVVDPGSDAAASRSDRQRSDEQSTGRAGRTAALQVCRVMSVVPSVVTSAGAACHDRDDRCAQQITPRA